MTDSPGSLFLRFLRFGALAWGGPAAQIERIKSECVDREGWVDAETFRKTIAVYQILPGPEATELCVYFGRIRGGKLGALMAGLGFVLPGFLLMLALTILYVEADLAGSVDEIFYGLAAAVVALVARALLRLGSSFLTDVPLVLIAAAAFSLTVFADVAFVIVLIGAGLAYELWKAAGRQRDGARAIDPSLPVIAAIAAAVTLPLTAEIFFEGLKAGLLTFGGAYTVIPFLQESAVESQGWLTQQQFVDGLALSGALPAPLIIFSTFVGYIAGGLAGRHRDDRRDLPPRLRLPDLPTSPARRRRGEPPHPPLPARCRRGRRRPDRGGRRGHRRNQHRRRPLSAHRRRCLPGADALALPPHRRLRRAGQRPDRRGPAADGALTNAVAGARAEEPHAPGTAK